MGCPSWAAIKEEKKMKTEKQDRKRKEEEKKVAEEMFKTTRLWVT